MVVLAITNLLTIIYAASKIKKLETTIASIIKQNIVLAKQLLNLYEYFGEQEDEIDSNN